MIQAGDKTYIYNGQNKVCEVRQDGKIIATFEYNIDGQIAKAIYGDKVEEFMWDGLALIWRSGVTYINEPCVTGGNPLLAGDAVLFNDMLGSTMAVDGTPLDMTSFGETADKNAFFTGKPMVDELGYSFLFRDYAPAMGKWTTPDPLGYPDGWNNLAYVNNGVTTTVDYLGELIINCLDINNNGNMVNTAAEMVLGSKESGGMFMVEYKKAALHINPVNMEVTINLEVSLAIEANLVASQDVSSGKIVAYKPHETTLDDAVISNGFLEAMLAHELGHANSFFATTIPYLRNYLLLNNIDSGFRSHNEVSELVAAALRLSINASLNDSITKANLGTCSAFDNTWQKLSTVGGIHRWIKE
jgi:RHS repeat-associated protein